MSTAPLFLESLRAAGVTFFSGVPDSLLKEFCAHLPATASAEHVIAANEGGAIAIAAGHYLVTGSIGLVYMQNSGLGNAVNPLLSLADPAVYGIPILLLIGWRGQPGVADEPQHLTQGRVTPALLEALEIPFRAVTAASENLAENAHWAVKQARLRSGPAALLLGAGLFAPANETLAPAAGTPLLSREQAIRQVAGALPAKATLVATTGKISRELYEVRKLAKQDGAGDFLTVGSMGHASQIALGIALARPGEPIVCLDGDGAVLMHMGSLAVIGQSAPANFLHVILNNGAHDSVGGQPTAGFRTDLCAVAMAAGYRAATRLECVADIAPAIADALASQGPIMIEIRVGLGARADLGRPRETPRENRERFMARLGVRPS